MSTHSKKLRMTSTDAARTGDRDLLEGLCYLCESPAGADNTASIVNAAVMLTQEYIHFPMRGVAKLGDGGHHITVP